MWRGFAGRVVSLSGAATILPSLYTYSSDEGYGQLLKL
jgi:hypothetical protein